MIEISMKEECDRGVYIAVSYLNGSHRICVGRLGRINFQKGVYFYVGNAQRNLPARLKRHGKKKKRLRWHIDYLSAKAKMVGAIIVSGPKEYECRIARELGKMFGSVVPDFGASDCRCGGHLFYASEFSS